MPGDKEFMAHEVGLDPNAQDDHDMQRLGKTQLFKVRAGADRAGMKQ